MQTLEITEETFTERRRELWSRKRVRSLKSSGIWTSLYQINNVPALILYIAHCFIILLGVLWKWNLLASLLLLLLHFISPRVSYGWHKYSLCKHNFSNKTLHSEHFRAKHLIQFCSVYILLTIKLINKTFGLTFKFNKQNH